MRDPCLLDQFKSEVHDKSDQIDPFSEEDWHSLILGWAIGKGLTIEEAHVFANYVRYETNLG
jgi:hypothetical protein